MPPDPESPRSFVLSSGHEVRFRQGDGNEEIEVRSQSGAVELTIYLTKDGPIAKIAGSQLQVETPGKLGIHCGELEIHATNRMTVETGEAIVLKTDGEIRTRSSQQTFIDGDYVNLNCGDRTGYHDADLPNAENS